MKIVRVALLTLTMVLGVGALASSAYAVPSYSTTCSSCHSGPALAVSTTLVANVAGNSTYSFTAPGADAVAVFQGITKRATVNASTGQFTVANGQTYTVYAVSGPRTSSGLGSATLSPTNPATTPPSNPGTPGDPPPTATPPVISGTTTIAGSNRYETAVQASKQAFPTGATSVVIATGANWPDALGGGALAAATDGPVLLTKPTSLPASVVAEIKRLGAKRAYILGGTSAVDASVERTLRDLLGTSNVTRIGGRTRYETAEKIAQAVVDEVEDAESFDGGAFIATGANFPDALAATPLSVATRKPIFLVGPKGLSSSTRSAMRAAGVSEVVVLGGTGAVSSSVEAALRSSLGSSHVERLAGANRYATAVDVATYGVEELGLSWDGLAIATGDRLPRCTRRRCHARHGWLRPAPDAGQHTSRRDQRVHQLAPLGHQGAEVPRRNRSTEHCRAWPSGRASEREHPLAGQR